MKMTREEFIERMEGITLSSILEMSYFNGYDEIGW